MSRKDEKLILDLTGNYRSKPEIQFCGSEVQNPCLACGQPHPARDMSLFEDLYD